jgi:membrane fusion protein, multidrug efflux system
MRSVRVAPLPYLLTAKVAASEGCEPSRRYIGASMATSSVVEDVARATGVATPEIARERSFYNRRLVFAVAGLVVLIALAVLAPRMLYAFSHVTTDDAYVDAYPAVVSARVAGAVVAIPVHDGESVRRGQVLARLDDTDARSEVLRARQQLLTAQAALAQAQYEARAETSRYNAAAERASALGSQAGERTRSLMLTAQSNSAAAAATKQSIAEAQADLDAANAQIPAAQTRLQTARDMRDRLQDLSKQGLISTLQLENSQNDYAQALAALQSARSRVAQARSNLVAMRAKANADQLQSDQARAAARAEQYGETLAQSDAMENSQDILAAKNAAVTAQQAQVEAAKEALQLAQYKLTETVLRAPVDGYVASRPGTVGEALQAGDPAVVVMPASDLYVTANFKETQLDRIREGAPADVHIDAFPKMTFHGHVEELGAAAQSALSIAPETRISGNFVKITQRVPIRIVIDRTSVPANAVLRPGMSAEVSVSH